MLLIKARLYCVIPEGNQYYLTKTVMLYTEPLCKEYPTYIVLGQKTRWKK